MLLDQIYLTLNHDPIHSTLKGVYDAKYVVIGITHLMNVIADITELIALLKPFRSLLMASYTGFSILMAFYIDLLAHTPMSRTKSLKGKLGTLLTQLFPY